MKLALKITPQRSTQYAHMTAALAMPELLCSPLRAVLQDAVPVTLAGHAYILATVSDSCLSSPLYRQVLSQFGAISEVYEYFDQVADVSGPLLRPVEPQFTPFVPLEMAEARRYKGKTNETFTRVLLNTALFSSRYAEQYSERLRILDPLCGGGTTLFLALASGHDAFGIEQERQDIDTTAVFIKQYLQSERISYKETDERGRKAGRRFQFEIGPKGNTRHLVLANGDTGDSLVHMREIPGGPRMHIIAGDLPYGIQHFAEIAKLLQRALPAWENMLYPGGTLALAWNATRVERTALIDLISQKTNLQVLTEPPYDQFVHPVDRVIKRRDILVAIKP